MTCSRLPLSIDGGARGFVALGRSVTAAKGPMDIYSMLSSHPPPHSRPLITFTE